ncbi:DUF2306 domain-containing protein [Lacibacter luteus]|uniref:DUF2306 domain-containing protein n=1 Tax=Lacibacter luteus TaxID=2508719 RepID=A0A4Q1CNX3_9BACT|nr:DUF2306 domain-containing protein [Lacibacter luteus]RXK62838.1 DUF2306 domain-containing protein [Lacibacter luteus]
MHLLRSASLVFLWAMILLLSLYFFFDNVIAYFYGYRSRLFGISLFQNQLWVVMHMVGGTFALLLGPFQFWPFIRKRFVQFHRTSGKVYMFGILLIGISAGRLSLISSCVPCRISLFLLTLFVVVSTWFAWRAIKAGNTKVHRQMMIRSYICVLAFVMVRFNDLFSLDFLFGKVADPLYSRVVQEYFWSFVPLIIAEIFIVWIPQTFPHGNRKSI